MTKRVHIIFKGHVQGVGFRYAAKRLAESFSLTGWVKNLPDGNVEVVAEGEEKTISEFAKQLEEHFLGLVSKKEINWTKASGEFRDFRIAY